MNKGKRRRARIDDLQLERLSRAVLNAVRSELADVDFFTREDMLHLSPLQHVATITRYHSLTAVVQRLVGSRRLVELSRTELALPEKQSRYNPHETPLHLLYQHQIDRLLTWHLRDQGNDAPFDVMTLVDRWRSDQHLSLNAKRVAVRMTLRQKERDGKIKRNATSLLYSYGTSSSKRDVAA